MAKQLNVNLSMTADTSKAKAQLQQLQQQLTALINLNNKSSGFGITKEIQAASTAAAQLKVQLSAATDVNTGKLDLSRFSQQLNKSNMSLEKYQHALYALGPEGEKAFATLAGSIANADARISNANSKLAQFAVTLKNTARWQISSSVLHGFMGTLQSAYGYAQDLNESLTNIRIVTGQSTEQMAQFAKRANDAAKALSTTTTAYTDAALIFYQQGLGDKAVEERTNAVIKMAQVTGDNATEVSSYMTAIWNNFDNGSESLEHYADVITALGAATASSSAEISAGLEKFASVAENIGLSYEYSTSALATIVANTRQSADTVGTGLRTIFSRLEGLSLGDTLEDGVDLNKYSKALQTVGVNILDASGDLKDMDTILDDLAGKWENLNRAQQTALAQTVGGVRQYTTLIALMDNWGDMEQNLKTANESDGTLQKQADIYAESWEAAQKRVRASAEAIYKALLNDKFFITVNNGFSGFLDLINETIKGLGGLKGVLLMIGTIITQIYQTEIADSLANFGNSIMSLTKKGKDAVEGRRTEVNKLLSKEAFDDGTMQGSAKGAAYEAQGRAQQAMLDNAKNMTEEQRQIAQLLLDQNKALGEATIKQAELVKETNEEAAAQKRIFELRNGPEIAAKTNDLTKKAKSSGKLSAVDSKLAASMDQINFSDINAKKNSAAFKEMYTSLKTLTTGFKELGTSAQAELGDKAGDAIDKMLACFDKDGNIIETDIKNLQTAWAEWTTEFSSTDQAYQTALNEIAIDMAGLRGHTMEEIEANSALSQKFNEARAAAEKMTQQFVSAGQAETDLAGSTGALGENLEHVEDQMKKMGQNSMTLTQGLTQVGSAIMSAGMAVSALTGLIDVWSEKDASLGKRLLTTATTIGMLVPTIMSVVSGLGTASVAVTVFGTTVSLAMWQVTLIVMAITALIGVFALLWNAAHGPSDAEKNLTKLSEEADQAKESLKNARDAYNELKDDINNYDSILKAFKSCTSGTDEWREALQNLNSEVRLLIEKYPELRKYLTTDPISGALTLDSEGFQEAEKVANRQVTAAMLNSALADQRVAEATVDVKHEKLDDALYSTGITDQGYVKQAIDRGLANHTITGESLELDVENALQEMKNNFIEQAKWNVKQYTGLEESDEGYQEILNEYLQSTGFFDEFGNEIAEEWEYQQEVLTDVLSNDSVASALDSYTDSLGNANLEASNAISTLTASLLSDRTDLGNAEKRLAAKYVTDDVEARKQQLIEEENSNHSKDMDSDALAEETWARYLKASGHDWKLQKNAIQGTDDNRQYGYIDDQGKEQTIDFSEMASIIAAYEALEQVGVQGDKAAETLSKLDQNVPKDIAGGLRDFMTSGNLNSLTEKGLADVQNKLDIDESGNASEESIDKYLMNAFGVSDKSELIAILGENYNAQFNEAQKLYADSLQKFTDSIPAGVQQAFASIDSDDMSLTGKQAVLDMLERAMIEGGASARDKVAKVLQDLPDDKVDDFSSALANINWDTAKVDDIKGALDAAGVSTKDLNIDFLGLIDAMKSTETVGLKSVQETFKQVADIAKGMSIGDTINAEDYATLVDEYGKSFVDGYFSVMADGTHQLIGDAEDFYSLVVEQQRDKMLNNIEQNANLNNSFQNTTVQALNSGNFSTGDQAAAAIEYLKTLELTDKELIALQAAQEEYNNTQTYSKDTYAMLNSMMQEHKITEEQFTALVEQNSQAIRDNSEAILSSATSLSELDGLAAQVAGTSGGAVYGYAEALIGLASQYDNCTQEIEAYQQALTSGNEATIAAAQDSLRAAVTIGELSKKYNLVAEDVETQARLLRANRKELDLTEEEAARLAVANQRMNRGVETLNKNFKDWKKVLNSADHTTQDYAETLNDALDALADLTGAVDAASIPLDFLDNTTADGAKHLQWMEKAANGDIQAINLLGSALAVASVKAMELDESFAKAFAEATQTDVANIGNKFIELQNTVSTAMNDIHNAIESGMSVDQIQAKIDSMGTRWVDALNQMAIATGMSVEQMNSLLNQLGVQAQVEVKDVEQKMRVPTYTEYSQSELVSPAEYETVDGVRTLTKPSTWSRKTWTVPGESVEVDGVVQVAQISTEGNPMSPAVKYTGTGGSSRGSGVSPSSTSSGGKGGGGGGGSAPKYNEEKHKNTNDEKERYHVIKNQLEDLTSQYENISNAKDKAFGAARLANLNKEISAQKKLTQANKEYLSEIEKYLAEDKAAVRALGAEIDENGTITNYDALIQKAVDDYNAAVDAFNRTTTDDEGAKKAFEAAQERYDQFMETISQYEETQDLYKEQMQQILDDIMTEQSLLLERTQLEVELKINVSEDALEYLEYMMDNIENKAYDCAEAFGYLNDMTQEYFKTAEALEGGLRSLFANQGLTDADFQKLIEGDTATYEKLMDMLSSGGAADLSDGLQQSEIDAAYGFTAEDVDTMRDYVSQLIEANQNLQEIRQTVHEQILNVWDEWNEKLDDGIAKIEHLQSITESYQNIIDIVGQKNLGVSNAFMSKMRQQSIDQANDKLEAEKARYESLKKARDDAYAKFEEQKAKGILSPEEIKQWEDSLAQMDEDVQSASESFQSAWEDALTAANEAFEAAVDQIIQAYDDAAAGLMGSMSDLQDAFDRKSDLSSQYLADYEKIYQLTKLNRDLENSIDSTNNTKAKAELLELQSKINAYEEAGIDISEYQMEQLRQEYELKKAQIELEESQEAKSQVQMTRDADGNYSYVYTANADDVAKAEQNYEDKLHQMQESNANYINDLQSNMIQMEQDYQDKVQEIMKDTSLTAEERMVKLNELNQYYDEKMKFYMSEAELWEENSQRLYEEDWMNYAAATGYKISSEEEWLDHWNETQLSILTGFGSLEEYQTNHNMNVANLLLSSSDAFATWQTNIETAIQNAGTSMADFEEDATDVLGTVAEESEKTKDSVVNMAEKATNAIGEVVNAVVDWENQYSATVQKMLAWNNALITSFNKLIAGWSAVQSSANSSGAGSGSGNGSGSGSGNGSNSGNGFNSSSGNSNGSNGGSGVDNSDKVAGVAAAIWLDGDASGWGNNPTRVSRLKEKGVEGAQAYINAHGANGDIYADWASKKGQLRKYYYGSFDTGGYTGEWGLDGKFAMLHEKELVLNKDDTTHFLQAIDIVRQISELIDLNALSSAGGLSSLLAATASSSSQKLEQQVTIHAEFPNVTDKDQITEAFTDLVNLASQYANRK